MSIISLLLAVALVAATGPDPSRFRLAALGRDRIAAVSAISDRSVGHDPAARFGIRRQVLKIAKNYPLLFLAAFLLACMQLIGVVPAGAGVAMCLLLNAGWQQRGRRRESQRRSVDLAGALAALGDELKAGATTAAAFTAVAAMGGRFAGELTEAGVAAGDGDDLCGVLANSTQLQVLGAACSVAAGIGSELRPVLQVLSDDLRAEQQTRDAVSSVLAGPMTSAMLLAMLPVVGLAMGAGMGARPVFVLLHTGAGLIALCLGLLLEAAGLLWTMLIVHRASP